MTCNKLYLNDKNNIKPVWNKVHTLLAMLMIDLYIVITMSFQEKKYLERSSHDLNVE